MDEEADPQASGRQAGSRAIIDDRPMQDALRARGYGELDGKRYVLQPYEALYLMHAGRLSLKKGSRQVSFESMMQSCKKDDAGALEDFLVYRDLRSRGYVVRGGFGFGADFVVYERGGFGAKGAKYLVFGLAEGRPERMGQLHKKVGQISQMGKEPIIAVIERRGEIIYYKVSRTAFGQNPHRAGTTSQ